MKTGKMQAAERTSWLRQWRLGGERLRMNRTGQLLQQGHFIENLNFAESPSANTCTLLYVRMTNRWAVQNCSFREAAIGIRELR